MGVVEAAVLMHDPKAVWEDHERRDVLCIVLVQRRELRDRYLFHWPKSKSKVVGAHQFVDMQVARRQREDHQVQPRGAQHEQLRRELRPEQIVVVPVQRQNVSNLALNKIKNTTNNLKLSLRGVGADIVMYVTLL